MALPTNPPILNPGMLDYLSAQVIATGAIRRSGLLPGLSRHEQRQMLSERGIELEFSAELETWWEWTDGVRDDYSNPYRTLLGGYWGIRPLFECTRRFLKRIAADDAINHTASQRARWLDGSLKNWFPIAVMERGTLYCECGPGLEISRVHLSADTLRIPAHVEPAEAPSLGTVVSLWIEAMEREVWTFDKSTNLWQIRDEWPELPPVYRRFVFEE